MNYIRYGIVFLAVALGAAVLISLLNTQVDSTLESGAQLMVPAMIAALIEGQQFARNARAKPGSAQIWGFTWIATGLNVALAYLAGGMAPEFGKLAIAAPLSQQFLVLLGLYAGGYLIFNRIFAGIGAGNQLSLMRSRGEI